MVGNMKDQLTLLPQDRPVSHSALPGSKWAKQMTATSGRNLLALYENVRPNGPLAKMLLASSGWASTNCFLTWIDWATPRKHLLYRLTQLGRSINEIGSGLLPTPSGTSSHGKNHVMGRLDEWGGSSNPWRGTTIGKVRCASFEEWMMGFPIGWTDLTESETQSCRKSQK